MKQWLKEVFCWHNWIGLEIPYQMKCTKCGKETNVYL
jgi:hypothetical protein